MGLAENESFGLKEGKDINTQWDYLPQMANTPVILSFNLKNIITQEVKIFTEICFCSDSFSFSLSKILHVETVKRSQMTKSKERCFCFSLFMVSGFESTCVSGY